MEYIAALDTAFRARVLDITTGEVLDDAPAGVQYVRAHFEHREMNTNAHEYFAAHYPRDWWICYIDDRPTYVIERLDVPVTHRDRIATFGFRICGDEALFETAEDAAKAIIRAAYAYEAHFPKHPEPRWLPSEDYLGVTATKLCSSLK